MRAREVRRAPRARAFADISPSGDQQIVVFSTIPSSFSVVFAVVFSFPFYLFSLSLPLSLFLSFFFILIYNNSYCNINMSIIFSIFLICFSIYIFFLLLCCFLTPQVEKTHFNFVTKKADFLVGSLGYKVKMCSR